MFCVLCIRHFICRDSFDVEVFWRNTTLLSWMFYSVLIDKQRIASKSAVGSKLMSALLKVFTVHTQCSLYCKIMMRQDAGQSSENNIILVPLPARSHNDRCVITSIACSRQSICLIIWTWHQYCSSLQRMQWLSGFHKCCRNLGTTSRVEEPGGWWYEASVILRTQIGVTCELHSFLELSAWWMLTVTHFCKWEEKTAVLVIIVESIVTQENRYQGFVYMGVYIVTELMSSNSSGFIKARECKRQWMNYDHWAHVLFS